MLGHTTRLLDAGGALHPGNKGVDGVAYAPQTETHTAISNITLRYHYGESTESETLAQWPGMPWDSLRLLKLLFTLLSSSILLSVLIISTISIIS